MRITSAGEFIHLDLYDYLAIGLLYIGVMFLLSVLFLQLTY